MRQTINPSKNDAISVYDDWGYADGIHSQGYEVVLYVLSDEQITAYRAALDAIEADRKRRAAMREHPSFGDTGPEMAGFEAEVA
jgi:hypothetical protein